MQIKLVHNVTKISYDSRLRRSHKIGFCRVQFLNTYRV